jgi:hypothetical protein
MRIVTCLRLRISAAAFAVALLAAISANAACSYPWGPLQNWPPPWFETNWFLPETPENLLDHAPPTDIGGLLRFWNNDFGHAEYWHRFQHYQTPFSGSACQSEVLPERSEDAYVSFGVVAVVGDDDDIEMGQLYVGGWGLVFDAGLGGHPRRPVGEIGSQDYDPRDAGFLHITGGSLKSGGCKCEPGMENTPVCLANPPVQVNCYERVGYRGTRGEINQTGGYHEAPNAISLGLGSSCADPDDDDAVCSHGIYRLSGGTLKVPSMDCGIQGKGEFEMTGGVFDSSLHQGSSFVGRRYTYDIAIDGNIPIAGHCSFSQSGGELTQGSAFFVGHGTGAVGEMTISGDAVFDAIGSGLWAGGSDDENGDQVYDEGGGTATIVQMGGQVTSGWFLMLGAKPGSDATYTISGGTLAQTACCGVASTNGLTLPRGMYVGVDWAAPLADGHGEFIVEGADSTIDVAGVFHQGSDSFLTFRIEELAPHISPIYVSGTATFEPGAKIKLEPLGSWTPGGNQHFTVLSVANQVVGESNLTVDASSGPWSLNWSGAGTGASPRTLVVTKLHGCGLLGIEAVVVLALLEGKRRWRRARDPRHYT